MRLLLFLIVFYCAGPAITTEVNTHITFKCTLNTHWCVEATVLENDNMFPDIIAKSGKQCQSIKEVLISMHGTVFGFGYKNEIHDIEVQIKHNCSSDGRSMQLRANLGSFKSVKEFADFKKYGDITNVDSIGGLLNFNNGKIVNYL